MSRTTMLTAGLLGAAIVFLVNGPPQHRSESPIEVRGVELTGGGEVPEPVKIRLNACQNTVEVANQITLWTMLIGEKPGYVDATIKMLKSAKRHSSVAFAPVLLVLAQKPLTPEAQLRLEKAGWSMCTVDRIPPPDEEATFKHFRDQFTKFALWNMVELDTVLYLDADTYIVGDIGGLFTLKLGSKKIGAGRDFMHGRWVNGFNMGVFLIHPNKADYDTLMAYHRGDKDLTYDKHWSEQAFLNSLWRQDWLDIGFEYNANLAVYTSKRELWNSREGNIRLVHYTIKKPWKGCLKSDYAEICKWWLEER